MYQGKFSQKGKTPAPQTAPQPKPESRAQPTPQPKPRPVSQITPQAPAPVKKQKRQATLGTTIFYTLYFLLIVLFCLATFLGLRWLNGWLMDFEASQPTVKSQEVFQQLFQDPKWEDLYVSAGIEDSIYENAESFAAYMEERIAGQELTFVETSAGLSGDKKYNVRLGSEKIASFTLEDHNTSKDITTIPDWQLGQVELFFDRDMSYQIVKLDGHTAQVNGVALQEGDILQIATTVAEEYLPSGVSAPRLCTQAVDGLFQVPEVKIFDKEGTEQAVTYDETTRTFTESTVAEQIPDDLKQIALDASQYYALWMKAEVDDKKVLKSYFLEGTDTYQAIIRTTIDYVQQGSSWEFTDISVSDYCRYDENHFSVRVEMNLSETRSSGTVKDWPYGKSMIFQKQSDGKWLCILSVNFHLSEPVGRVRLTFMQDEIPVSSDFYYTDSDEIITPIVSAPEGKVFAGWVQKVKDENGKTALELVFQPDSTGHVAIPEGQYLTPMTLYAHFESLGGN